MARALELARRGWYTTMPNPRVGCVLVRDEECIAEGWHQRAGEGHAEVNALATLSAQQVADVPLSKGATAYVTLEPCSHTGRTGPCCDALIDAGISRLVFGMQDPNPQVSGRGLEKIRAAGIQVDGPLFESEARGLNPGFIKRMEAGLPRVICKLAMSVDGRTAMSSGESQWITGAAARSDVQRLRAGSCAIVTGIGSIQNDDSSLTVREQELSLPPEQAQQAAMKQPLRVVLDSKQQLPINARVLADPKTALVVSCREPGDDLAQLGVEQLNLPNADGRIDLKAVLSALAERQCNEVMVEAGAELAGAFVAAELVDELYIYMAPVLMGSDARPLLQLPLQQMSEKRSLKIKDVRALGDDWRFIVEPQ